MPAVFTINDFATHVRNAGLQRANRFHLEMTLPDRLITCLREVIDNELQEEFNNINNMNDGRQAEANQGLTAQYYTPPRNPLDDLDITKVLALTATNVNIPGVNVSTNEMHLGTTRRIAYDKGTGEFSIVFRCSGNMIERKVFDTWIKMIFQKDHTVAYYDDYVAPSFKIYSCDVADNVTYFADVDEVYPAIITELPFDREGQNTFMNFSVTFNYRKVKRHEDFFPRKDSVSELNFNQNVKAVYSSSNQIAPQNLPLPPDTSNMPYFIIDVIKSVDRIRREVENGTLSGPLGRAVIINIMRDANAAFGGNPLFSKALEYANDLSFILGRVGK